MAFYLNLSIILYAKFEPIFVNILIDYFQFHFPKHSYYLIFIYFMNKENLFYDLVIIKQVNSSLVKIFFLESTKV